MIQGVKPQMQDALDASQAQVAAAMSELAKQAAVIKALEREIQALRDVIASNAAEASAAKTGVSPDLKSVQKQN